MDMDRTTFAPEPPPDPPLTATLLRVLPEVRAELWEVTGDGVPVGVYFYPDTAGGWCLRCGDVACRHQAAAWAAKKGPGESDPHAPIIP